ncbi:hypothetical protein GGTG_11992 [Gaeumannomyces tritici R3-111a-1]|uniref:Uncharacterized protein n=1 Tax=Gaeumannomyces tritici (strain R3-111a-1) TaxID=644352 RepID=J3PER1_GAET3|nr:hypothetical protein GGTG_11992 [Gaeumannomyces tritici R3-111a-1]EJT70969.1 hypothetical protein GGTG_11992 [Gaeumannomyces tritici R3-111a-1]
MQADEKGQVGEKEGPDATLPCPARVCAPAEMGRSRGAPALESATGGDAAKALTWGWGVPSGSSRFRAVGRVVAWKSAGQSSNGNFADRLRIAEPDGLVLLQCLVGYAARADEGGEEWEGRRRQTGERGEKGSKEDEQSGWATMRWAVGS